MSFGLSGRIRPASNIALVGGRPLLTTSGTWTVPETGMYMIILTGAGCASSGQPTGAGATAIYYKSLVIGESYSYSIGSGASNPGGNTTFGSFAANGGGSSQGGSIGTMSSNQNIGGIGYAGGSVGTYGGQFSNGSGDNTAFAPAPGHSYYGLGGSGAYGAGAAPNGNGGDGVIEIWKV